jgi:hypothetical protein
MPDRGNDRHTNEGLAYPNLVAVHSADKLRMPGGPFGRVGGILARSATVAVLLGALSFFVSLLLSILTFLVVGMLMGRFKPDMTLAYRQVAPTVAVCVLVLGFVASMVWEFRSSTRT